MQSQASYMAKAVIRCNMLIACFKTDISKQINNIILESSIWSSVKNPGDRRLFNFTKKWDKPLFNGKNMI